MKTNGRKESKTDTIVQRTINVYLPTFELKEKWKELAEASNQSISKFIIEHVTNSWFLERFAMLERPLKFYLI